MTELTKTLAQTSELMATLLLIVALISLVVGGVGIMNIMLVSVTERAREIGLRMAVGARSYHILRQFLVEAVVLCLFGGGIGIIMGRGASILVRAVKHWPTEISLPAIIAAVAVSASVGIVFGFYPAWKASRLDPIEAPALRIIVYPMGSPGSLIWAAAPQEPLPEWLNFAITSWTSSHWFKNLILPRFYPAWIPSKSCPTNRTSRIFQDPLHRAAVEFTLFFRSNFPLIFSLWVSMVLA